jgi:hypothetical protein
VRLYLNVDGVINAFQSYKVWDSEGDFGSDDYKGFAVMWSMDMVDRLKSLESIDNGLELIWVSSWMGDARGFAKLVGLGALGEKAKVVGPVSGVMTFPDVYWKAEAIWEDLRGYSGDWAWFDPVAVELMGIADYADFVSGDGYVPVIDVAYGITPEMLIELELRMEKEVI